MESDHLSNYCLRSITIYSPFLQSMVLLVNHTKKKTAQWRLQLLLNIDRRELGLVHHPQWSFAQRSLLFSHGGASKAIPLGGTQLCHKGVYEVELRGWHTNAGTTQNGPTPFPATHSQPKLCWLSTSWDKVMGREKQVDSSNVSLKL